MNRDAARQRLSESRLYGTLQLVNKFLDRYYLDGVVGLLPFGMGDWFTAAISLVYVYFGAALHLGVVLLGFKAVGIDIAAINPVGHPDETLFTVHGETRTLHLP